MNHFLFWRNWGFQPRMHLQLNRTRTNPIMFVIPRTKVSFAASSWSMKAMDAFFMAGFINL